MIVPIRGDELKVKILQITGEAIYYKLWNSPNGSSYTFNKKDVLLLRQEDGKNIIFQNQNSNTNNRVENKPVKIETLSDLENKKNTSSDENQKEIKNGFLKVDYGNGLVYEGEWFNNKKDGKGKMTYKGGGYYDGEWRRDKKNGNGIMKYNDGTSYEGGWKENEKEGSGKITDKYGYFVGTFVAGKRTGKGTIYYNNGMIAENVYKDGKLHGSNKVIVTHDDDTATYEGVFNNGVLNGLGTMSSISKNGEKKFFKGEFKDDQMYNGELIIVNPNEKEEWVSKIKDGQQKKAKRRKD